MCIECGLNDAQMQMKKRLFSIVLCVEIQLLMEIFIGIHRMDVFVKIV